jgi:NADPH-dependent 2,4-dienoyl-CoA reductase/sulfur reductase-like enzyme
MKRPRTEDSTNEVSLGESNGGSVDVQMVNGNHDSKPVKESSSQVVVVGAGPGGLMLACVLEQKGGFLIAFH